ncbi:MAG TPA: RHS repeat domain-containing protein, partial [Kribbellaceae bacterium]
MADQVTRWTYDQRGLVLSETTPRGNTTATADPAYTTNYTYDELGRVVKCDPKCQAARKHQQDLQRTQRSHDQIQQQVTSTSVPTSAKPQCAAGNPACGDNPGRPSPVIATSRDYGDNGDTSSVRTKAIQSNGSVGTNVSPLDNACALICMGIGTGLPTWCRCTGGGG